MCIIRQYSLSKGIRLKEQELNKEREDKRNVLLKGYTSGQSEGIRSCQMRRGDGDSSEVDGLKNREEDGGICYG